MQKQFRFILEPRRGVRNGEKAAKQEKEIPFDDKKMIHFGCWRAYTSLRAFSVMRERGDGGVRIREEIHFSVENFFSLIIDLRGRGECERKRNDCETLSAKIFNGSNHQSTSGIALLSSSPTPALALVVNFPFLLSAHIHCSLCARNGSCKNSFQLRQIDFSS